MKTTIELPDHLLREAKSRAALQGRTLRSIFEEALESHLRSPDRKPSEYGWRRVFGQAQPEDVAEIDSIVNEDLGAVEPESWR